MLQLHVWWRRDRLDRELADGHSPAARDDLRLRADQLVSARGRRALAAVIRHVVDAAEEPLGVLDRQAPSRAVNRVGVMRARDDLLELARRLDGRDPISPQGAARAQLLTCDESSLLYGTAPPEAVRAAVEAVREALQHE